MSEPFGKVEIVNHLAQIHGFRRYLEICTPTTGLKFADIDRARLSAHRLMYHCPPGYSDGLAIDFQSGDADISSCLREIESGNLRYDIVLVDPYHEYDTSLRDLVAAFGLIEAGGFLVVHDCLPPSEATAAPHILTEGPWCGVTYKAYLDFVIARRDLTYCTIDTDYGCGIIRRLGIRDRVRRWMRWQNDGAGSAASLVADWRKLGRDFQATYRFFEQHHRELLKLRAVEEFLRESATPH
jgi:hypothetical protein